MFKQSLAKTALVLMAGLLMAGTVAAKEMKIGLGGCASHCRSIASNDLYSKYIKS